MEELSEDEQLLAVEKTTVFFPAFPPDRNLRSSVCCARMVMQSAFWVME